MEYDNPTDPTGEEFLFSDREPALRAGGSARPGSRSLRAALRAVLAPLPDRRPQAPRAGPIEDRMLTKRPARLDPVRFSP